MQSKKATFFTYLFFVCIMCGMVAHIVGLLTDHWLVADVGSLTVANATSDLSVIITNVNVGLWRTTIFFSNQSESCMLESLLNINEEQYIIIAIAAINVIQCFIIVYKAVHMVIGVSVFIVMTLMMISAFYCFDHTAQRMILIQEQRIEWPHLTLSWSFILMFGGLLLNIVSTAVFLILTVMGTPTKAAQLSNVPEHSNMAGTTFTKLSKGKEACIRRPSSDKTHIIDTVSHNVIYKNEAYLNEMFDNKSESESVNHSNCYPTDISVFDSRPNMFASQDFCEDFEPIALESILTHTVPDLHESDKLPTISGVTKL